MRFWVALALLFSITPGVAEVFEAAVHVVVHADLPHHEADLEEARGCSEHTCTPLAHHCSCHSTMSAQTSSRGQTSSSPVDVTHLDPVAVDAVFGRACEPPPLRPPIA